MKQILTVVLLMVIACQLPAQQNGLPAIRPADFTLSFHFDGGMSYHFVDIAITKDSCIYKLNEKGSIFVTRFKLTDAGLDSLYAVLLQNQFTQIKYRNEGMVYDRGGESITVRWNNGQQRFTVNDSQSFFVQDDWKVRWGAICDYVTKLPHQNKVKPKK